MSGYKARLFIYQTQKQIPEEAWQASDGARFISQRPFPPFPSHLVHPWGGASNFQATKAGHGQQALMFILADRPPSPAV